MVTIKIVFVGDIHARGTNPRNRLGNYFKDLEDKLFQVFEIAKKYGAPIVCTGDFFDSPNVSISVINGMIKILRQCPVDFYCIPGNHDIFGHNLDTVDRTPLGLLFTANYLEFAGQVGLAGGIQLTGRGFDYTIDADYHEYIVPELYDPKIVVVHGMLLPESPPFEMKHSLVSEVARRSNADVIVTGHYHLPFTYRLNGKLIFNPGALMRISASVSDINHKPKVVVLDTETLEYEDIFLKVKLADEVLDRTQIEADTQRELDMQRFINSLEATGESRFMDIQNIIESIAKKEELHPEIVKEALNRVSAAREKKKGETL